MNDFSRYDRVMVPVMIFSEELKLIYTNEVARRTYPLLASPSGISLYYRTQTLRTISECLRNGQAVTLPVESDVGGSIVFDPVFTSDGSVSHVCVYVESDLPAKNSFALLTDEEILGILNREITCPVCDLIQVSNRVRGKSSIASDSELGQALAVMHDRLIRVSLFLSRMEDSVSDAGFAICDADAALCLCAERFSPMKYDSQARCYVPMERNRFLRLLTDILSSVYFCQSPGQKVGVTLIPRSDAVDIVFQSGHLSVFPGPDFLMEQDPLCGNFFSVRGRVERVGGRLEIQTKPARKTVTVTVSLPPVCYESGQIRVGDPEEDFLSFTESLALDFLEVISREAKTD